MNLAAILLTCFSILMIVAGIVGQVPRLQMPDQQRDACAMSTFVGMLTLVVGLVQMTVG